ncbi:hypothetical protein Tco_0993162 [Tanacetum coccineum]|uniref:Uncharacterized protein n=1 Tax=Tanacetum coccineum TaxID=301880 RepID=A0ABQ5F443_9ASTR
MRIGKIGDKLWVENSPCNGTFFQCGDVLHIGHSAAQVFAGQRGDSWGGREIWLQVCILSRALGLAFEVLEAGRLEWKATLVLAGESGVAMGTVDKSRSRAQRCGVRSQVPALARDRGQGKCALQRARGICRIAGVREARDLVGTLGGVFFSWGMSELEGRGRVAVSVVDEEPGLGERRIGIERVRSMVIVECGELGGVISIEDEEVHFMGDLVALREQYGYADDWLRRAGCSDNQSIPRIISKSLISKGSKLAERILSSKRNGQSLYS